MKNKILASLTALCAALVLVGGFSVTAYAQTPTEETDDSGVIVETSPRQGKSKARPCRSGAAPARRVPPAWLPCLCSYPC